MDKVKGDINKALFFVAKTVENGWSRSMLLNWLDTNLYEREGNAITNFENQLPNPMSDLAQEITKDPYSFAFAGIKGTYNEKLLKQALLQNITDFYLNSAPDLRTWAENIACRLARPRTSLICCSIICNCVAMWWSR